MLRERNLIYSKDLMALPKCDFISNLSSPFANVKFYSSNEKRKLGAY